MKLELDTYRVIDSKTGKPRGRAYKTIEAARAHARHLEFCFGRTFSVARVVCKESGPRT